MLDLNCLEQVKTAFAELQDGGERSDGDNFKAECAGRFKTECAGRRLGAEAGRRCGGGALLDAEPGCPGNLTEHLPGGPAVVACLRSLPVAPEEIYGERGG
jgi:hypothetical protein